MKGFLEQVMEGCVGHHWVPIEGVGESSVGGYEGNACWSSVGGHRMSHGNTYPCPTCQTSPALG